MKKSIKFLMMALAVLVTVTSLNVVSAASALVEVATKDNPMGSEYYWKHTNDVTRITYEVFGTTDSNADGDMIDITLTDDIKGKAGVKVNNIGVYGDSRVDAEITVMDWDVRDASKPAYVRFYNNQGFNGVEWNSEALNSVKVQIKYIVDGQYRNDFKGTLTMIGCDTDVIVGDALNKVYVYNTEVVTSEDTTDGVKLVFNKTAEDAAKKNYADVTFDLSNAKNNALTLTLSAEKASTTVSYVEFDASDSMSSTYAPTIGVEASREKATEGNIAKFVATIYEMKMYNAPVVTVEVDKDLTFVQSDVVITNKNNTVVTNDYNVTVSNNVITVAKKSDDKGTEEIKDVIINNAKVKASPALANALEDGKYYATVKATQGSKTGTAKVELYYMVENASEEDSHVTVEGVGQVVPTTDTEVTVTPEKGYYVTSLVVDGEEVDLEEMELADRYGKVTYTFENVRENHTVAAKAERIPATLYVYCIGPDGEELEEPVIREGYIGDSYETAPGEYEGYVLNEEKYPENANGVLEDTETVVVYYYDVYVAPDTGDINVVMFAAIALASVLGIVASRKLALNK